MRKEQFEVGPFDNRIDEVRCSQLVEQDIEDLEDRAEAYMGDEYFLKHVLKQLVEKEAYYFDDDDLRRLQQQACFGVGLAAVFLEKSGNDVPRRIDFNLLEDTVMFLDREYDMRTVNGVAFTSRFSLAFCSAINRYVNRKQCVSKYIHFGAGLMWGMCVVYRIGPLMEDPSNRDLEYLLRDVDFGDG